MLAGAWAGKRESAEERVSRQMHILTDATRQFSSMTRPSLAEINAYKDMFYQLIGACDTACRRAIAASLASFAYTPTPIAVFLASDAAEVATPVLMFSPALGEDHIVRLAGRLPRDYLRVLCRRSDLTAKAVKALIENGGEETRQVLRSNPAAKAFGGLVAPARQRAPIDRAPPPASPEPVAAKSELLRLAGSGGRTGRTNVKRPAEPARLSFARRLLLAARAGEIATVAALVATQAGSELHITEKLVRADEIEPTVILLKGLGVDSVTAMQVLLLLKPQIGADRVEFSRVSNLYRNVDVRECEKVLRAMAIPNSGEAAMSKPDTPAFVQAVRSRRAAIASEHPAPTRKPATRSFGQRENRAGAMN